MRAAVLSLNACESDAIGNQLAGRVSFLIERGWEVRVFVESTARLHAAVAPHCSRHTAKTLWRDHAARDYLLNSDLAVADYGQHYSLLDLLPAIVGNHPRVVVNYYGVTPPAMWKPGNTRILEDAQRQRGLVWCADAVFVPSHFAAKELHEATSYPLERIHRLPCFVDTEAFSPGSPTSDVRGPLALQDCHVLLFVGRLAPNKRVPLLVEAVARLRDSRRPVHAVIIGDDGDIYAAQAEACRERAEQLGVGDRVHLLGRVDERTLRDWYRSADVLVMPSLHESFCLPVVEAMACGLPVVAARTAALPETLGDAGLSFRADDLDDLVWQLGKVLRAGSVSDGWVPGHCSEDKPSLTLPARRSLSVAIVAPRYGPGFAGGAETSLRTIAHALKQMGHDVEVFTTCNRHESQWANHLPAGATEIDDITVHRFPIDSHDRDEHLTTLEVFRQKARPVREEDERAYLAHSLHSSSLVKALAERESEFDAIIAGPYLFGLTWRVACRFTSRVLLLPCFHDEPLARLNLLHRAYRDAGGILYHSEEEQWFTESELGLNHPCGTIIGTYLDLARHRKAGPVPVELRGTPYVVYCGRYSAEKGVHRLLEYAGRYAKEHPDRYRFVFMGQDGVQLPCEPWLVNLGHVTEETKWTVLGGARALVQLSTNESLSLVTLEAWTAGIPVIGHRGCFVIREQIRRSGGGTAIGNYDEFAAALDAWWGDPASAQRAGDAGQRYVHERYASLPVFAKRLIEAIHNMHRPLADQMREQGLRRAKFFSYQAWSETFAESLANLFGSPPVPLQRAVEIRPATERKTLVVARSGDRATTVGTILVPVRVTNRGSCPITPDGPAGTQLTYRFVASDGETPASLSARLPGLLCPGQAMVVNVPVAVPAEPATYRLRFTIRNALGQAFGAAGPSELTLAVQATADEEASSMGAEFLASIQQTLAEADQLKTLPDDYLDVTEGWLASWKRHIKQKLLNNFRKCYVDVLSRQQSAFNEKVLVALSQLSDCCSVLGQATAGSADQTDVRVLLKKLLRRQRHLQQSHKSLEERLAKLEQMVEFLSASASQPQP